MGDQPGRSGGRGSNILGKLKTRSPGQPTELETAMGAEKSPPKVQDEKPSSKVTAGRGQFLTHFKGPPQASEETTLAVPEIGVSSEIKPESKKGRGFLVGLSKQQQSPRPGESSSQSSVAEQKEEPVLERKMEELSVHEKEEDDEAEKPPVVKRGEMGERVEVALNYITLKTDPGKGVFEYDVRFDPEVDFVAYRYKLVNQHFQARKGIRCYDGGDKLYIPEKLPTDKMVIDAKHPNDESDVQIKISYKKQMRLKECSQLYNILINNCSKALHLTRLGRQHYDYKLSHQIPQHKLEVWPGYVTAVDEFEGGIHLCCDIRHRVLRTDTALDVISSLIKHDPQNFKNRIFKELIGQCVLTRYNNNLYRVDDVDWDKTPLSTFKLSSGAEITFLEYYKKQYNLQITDLKQPLLVNKPKSRRKEESQLICLVPEICHLTGLTDHMRKDMRVMKEIAMYTRVTPAQRHYAFKKFMENLLSNSRALEMLSDWGLSLSNEPLVTDARILPQEDLLLKNKVRCAVPSNLEWSKCLQSNGVFRGLTVKHWILVHTKRDTNYANSLWNMLLKVGPGVGIEICDPVMVPIGDDRIDSYIRALRAHLSPSVQMAVCLCPTPREDRYSAIKKLCCSEIPVPSQVVNTSTISREKRMRAVVQNIALQMNNKIGGASWGVHIPLRNTMICGIDTYHKADNKGYSVGAFVASIDPDFTRWYSKTCIQGPKQELVEGLVYSFAFALRKFLELNGVLPERVVIFRDGVGDGHLPFVQNFEITQFLETCEMVSKRYKPKFSFVVVQKRINTKFYLLSPESREKYLNPKSGCVLDHTVTRRNYYDFFLVSQHVTCGTATPSHYIVLYDTSELKPDLMQRLTYKCCHLYYNWAGTIRVPAPCQYAHKLAYLVGQNVKDLPKEILDDKLYYL